MSVMSNSVWPHRWHPTRLPVPGILQAKTLEWVAISFSSAWKWKVKVKSLSRVRLLATPLTAAYQAPPSMGFSRQEYWSGVPLPCPGMGKFNSDDHYIYYYGQEILRRNGVALTVNKRVQNVVLGCNLKNDRMISVHFQGNSFNITVIQVYAPTTNAEEAEVE